MKTDSEKLMLLAEWFDKRDAKSGELGENEVQKDLRRIASRLHKPEWISVKERLPEPGEFIWAWRNNGFKLAKRVIVSGSTLWHYDGDHRYTFDGPTHWMPLPEPPNV